MLGLRQARQQLEELPYQVSLWNVTSRPLLDQTPLLPQGVSGSLIRRRTNVACPDDHFVGSPLLTTGLRNGEFRPIGKRWRNAT